MKRLILVVLLAGGIMACRYGAGEQPIEAMLPSGGSSPTLTIGLDVVEPGNYEISLSDETGKRNVIVHIPPAYDGSLKLPLLIALHGGAGSGQHIQRLSRLDADADEYGFMVAYPDGSGRLDDSLLTWNAGHCCGYALENGVDDVAFIDLLIDRLISHYAVHQPRVYLTGISKRGM